MEGYQFDAYMETLLQQQRFNIQMNLLAIERTYKEEQLSREAAKINATRQRKEFDFQCAIFNSRLNETEHS